jgi:alkylation response protein AidB-like acyl-CoA dehydrogenase
VSASQIGVMLEQIAQEAVPLPGRGHTWDRFAALSAWAARDLSLGRLGEGHLDALAILAEAGREPVDPKSIYGVWAARSPTGGTMARLAPDGWHLSGRKEFCSGSGLIDRALVTADSPAGYLLFDLAVSENVTAARPDSWLAVGMADSLSETLEFGGPVIASERVIGAPGFYLDRPGFWFGAVGVAACWYGGAKGLVETLVASLDPSASDLVLSSLGEAVARVGAMRRVLADAAAEIDADPVDTQKRARSRALVVRHAVHRAASEVLDHVAAAGGARPLCHDNRQGQRAADLYVYLAQYHGPQNSAELGRIAVEGGVWNWL